ALTTATLAGGLWYRAAAVPDVGEPFDVAAFLAELPSPEKNEAGASIRKAGADLRRHRQEVEDQLGPPKPRHSLDRPGGGRPGGPGRPVPAGPELHESPTYHQLVDEVLQNGWPREDAELGRWLD